MISPIQPFCDSHTAPLRPRSSRIWLAAPAGKNAMGKNAMGSHMQAGREGLVRAGSPAKPVIHSPGPSASVTSGARPFDGQPAFAADPAIPFRSRAAPGPGRGQFCY
ncbi:hypothetical protein BDY21DRAFT_357425 [Lineolata rhizophorae]|uniref:Uncharacterized protein n=1 Tax=Lineolata rhizophorae TaxID=578093 RepID=A0A6A6NMH5_9PEZI|nr:hypothetical protein BDY21DRAFT_357425 [Lineolata rhizophorae]